MDDLSSQIESVSESSLGVTNNAVAKVEKSGTKVRRVTRPLPGMTTAWTDKLAHTVQKFPCLYDPAAATIKDMASRKLAWEKVGAQLGISGVMARTKWRVGRDNYTRYKRARERCPKDVEHVAAAYRSFQFLDQWYRRSATATSSPGPVARPKSNQQRRETRSPSVQEWTMQQDAESTMDITQSDASSIHSIGGVSSEKPTNLNDTDGARIVDRVLGHLEARKKSPDALDLMFMSFAASTRQLKPALQREIKTKVLQVILDAETAELEQGK